MSRTEEIAKEISIIMPAIAQKVLLSFFQEVDISQSQLLIIMAIKDMERCRLSDLSAAMHISDPTASGLVDRLHKGGYVKRDHDPEDRRALVITLSTKGEKLAQKFRTTVSGKWRDILQGIPKKDREDFIRILKDIRGNV